jgi:predicted phosphoserine aminotransferase
MTHPVLFIPGPVEVDPELREIMAMPAIGHRSKAAKECFGRLAPRLRELFGTKQHAFFENAPATALMEATIRNLVRSRVLHVTSGAFGDRWAEISKACGRSPDTVSSPWGDSVTPTQLREALQQATEPYEVVCITHNETSTGMICDLRALCAVVAAVSPSSLICVDVVTSLGGAEFAFDDWGIDVAFAGTQKCLALPPGICLFALSQRAVDRAATVEGRGFLIDFAATPSRAAKNEPPATPCVPLLFALERQLDRIAAEGYANRFARHRTMRDRTIAWAERHGYAPFVRDPALRSPTVSALRADAATTEALIAAGKAGGFTISKGYGKIASETFRIGHMGDHDLPRLDRLLAALSERQG